MKIVLLVAEYPSSKKYLFLENKLHEIARPWRAWKFKKRYQKDTSNHEAIWHQKDGDCLYIIIANQNIFTTAATDLAENECYKHIV